MDFLWLLRVIWVLDLTVPLLSHASLALLCTSHSVFILQLPVGEGQRIPQGSCSAKHLSRLHRNKPIHFSSMTKE